MKDLQTYAKELLEKAGAASGPLVPIVSKTDYEFECPVCDGGYLDSERVHEFETEYAASVFVYGIGESLERQEQFIKSCSPSDLIPLLQAFLAQGEALREAEEAMSMGAFHHNCCPWLNGKECNCAREKVDNWLAKYAKGEEG